MVHLKIPFPLSSAPLSSPTSLPLLFHRALPLPLHQGPPSLLQPADVLFSSAVGKSVLNLLFLSAVVEATLLGEATPR